MFCIRSIRRARITLAWSKARLFRLCVLLLVSGAQSFARDTYEATGPLKTSAGLLSTRPGTASECQTYAGGGLECQVMDLAGRVLFADYHVGIHAAFPSPKDPTIVFAFQSTGGNAYCWVNYLIDLTRHEPIVVRLLQGSTRTTRKRESMPSPRA